MLLWLLLLSLPVAGSVEGPVARAAESGRVLDLSRYPSDNLVLQQAITAALGAGDARAAWQLARQHLDFLHASPATLLLSAEVARLAGQPLVADQILRQARALWPQDTGLLELALLRAAERDECAAVRALLAEPAARYLPPARQTPASYGCHQGWQARQSLSIWLARSSSGATNSQPSTDIRPAAGSLLDQVCRIYQPFCPADGTFRLARTKAADRLYARLGLHLEKARSARPRRTLDLTWQTGRARRSGSGSEKLYLATGFGLGHPGARQIWLHPYFSAHRQHQNTRQQASELRRAGLRLESSSPLAPGWHAGAGLQAERDAGSDRLLRADENLGRVWLDWQPHLFWSARLEQQISWRHPAPAALYGKSAALANSLTVAYSAPGLGQLQLHYRHSQTVYERALPWLAAPHSTDSRMLELGWQTRPLGPLGPLAFRIGRIRHRSADPLSDYAETVMGVGLAKLF